MQAGQVVLFRFPQTGLLEGKLRAALLLAQLPDGFDEWLDSNAPDFKTSGLKTTSIVRTSRVAVIEAAALAGIIGYLSEDRLRRIRGHLASWLLDTDLKS